MDLLRTHSQARKIATHTKKPRHPKGIARLFCEFAYARRRAECRLSWLTNINLPAFEKPPRSSSRTLGEFETKIGSRVGNGEARTGARERFPIVS
jgi:hypothetical protein